MNSWQPFPVEALPEGIAQYVRELAQATGNDEAWSALIALTCAAGRIGNRVAATVKCGWSEPAVLWSAIVQRSGTCKSVPLRLATKPIIDAYKLERVAHAEAQAIYEAECEHYKVQLGEWQKAQRKGEGALEPPAKPVVPVEKRLLVSDVTCEKLGALLKDNPLGLLLVRDELAAWLGSFDRYASGKGSDGPTWLSFFDAANVTIDRKSGGTLFVERAAVSVLGTIQPGTLARVFGQAERESGLLARLLLVMPPSGDGKWTAGELSPEASAAWASTLQRLGDMAANADAHGNVVPHFIGLARAAKAEFITWHNRHMATIDEGTADDLAAHLSKLKGNCIRFSLILACLDHAPLVPARIEADHIERAITIAGWFSNEARRVYGMLAQAPETAERKRLVDWIRSKGGRVTKRDLQRMGPKQYRKGDEADAALADLAEKGYGGWVVEDTGGRQATVFELSGKMYIPCDTSPKNPAFSDLPSHVANVASPEMAWDNPPEWLWEQRAADALADDEGGDE